jgi:hypothetical protein
MNYQKIYNQIIERAKTRQLNCYKEKHHVIPRCMGGVDENNIVELTAKEHFLCHRLLCEIYPSLDKLKYALFLMAIGKNKRKENHYNISGKTYERIKIEWQLKVKGKPKPKGFMSDDIKSKISQANKGVSRNKGTKFTDEQKQKISQAKKGKPLNPQHAENLRIAVKNRKPWIKSSRQVEQYDLEGNLIGIFTSAKEVDIKMGGKGNNAADCCRGRQKTAYGFIWKYKTN